MSVEVRFLGDDIVILFSAEDSDGGVVDLTGATFAASCQHAGGSLVPADSATVDEPSTAGKARAVFLGATTALFTPDAVYDYDGRVRLASGKVHVIGNGQFVMRTPLTLAPPAS